MDEPRGAHGEFSTLLPAAGDPWVKLQAIGDEHPRMHLDIDVEDTDEAVERLASTGAERLASFDSVRVLRSPAGMVLCLTSWNAAGRASQQVREVSPLLDEVCLRVPARSWDVEVEFWQQLLARSAEPTGDDRLILSHDRWPVQVLLQRNDSTEASAAAHPHVRAADRAQEEARHVALGATVLTRGPRHTAMLAPDATRYCLLPG